MIVEVLKTDKRLGIRKGFWYKAQPYVLDPSKITLLKRITKKDKIEIGEDPMCNQYRDTIKIIE